MANTDPIFTGVPKVGVAPISVANAGRDGTGTIVDLITTGANGGRVDKIVAKATASTTAGMLRVFYKPSAGAWTLLTEIPVTNTQVSASTPGFEAVVDFLGGLVLPNGAKLGASSHNAETFVVTAFGGDF